MHECTLFLLFDLLDDIEGLMDIFGKDDFCTISTALRDTKRIGAFYHDNLGASTRALGGKGSGNGVVTGANRGDPLG